MSLDKFVRSNFEPNGSSPFSLYPTSSVVSPEVGHLIRQDGTFHTLLFKIRSYILIMFLLYTIKRATTIRGSPYFWIRLQLYQMPSAHVPSLHLQNRLVGLLTQLQFLFR